jgi:hypothetical protein
MVADFKQTKYFKYLAENLELMEIQRIEFNQKILSLLNNEIDEMGLVLKCHMIIEHYIDEFLIVAYPTISQWDKIRLAFNQKPELINNFRTVMGIAYPSVKCLNSLRNKFSHRLAYKIKEEDYKEIKEIMTIWYNASVEPIPTGLQLIEKFTVWFCGNCDTMIQGMKKQTPGLGLTGYLDWLKNMTTNE